VVAKYDIIGSNYAELLALDVYDAGYRIVVAESG